MAAEGKNLIAIVGPTASGKTRLGVRLAHALGGEIVSADSRQVYRGLVIGAGKDLEEYVCEGRTVPVHLIDVVDLDREFSVFEYQRRFFETFQHLRARRVLPILVGGTGLYVESVLNGYQMMEVPEDNTLRAELAALSHDALVARLTALKPRLHNITDLENRDRLVRAIEIAAFQNTHIPKPTPEVRSLTLGTRWPRDELRQRIRLRLDHRIEHGMIEEVEQLLARGVPHEILQFLGLEYRFSSDYLRGAIKNRNDLIQALHSAICRFAKRQQTWFRRMERQGTAIHWIDGADFDAAMHVVFGEPSLKTIATRARGV